MRARAGFCTLVHPWSCTLYPCSSCIPCPIPAPETPASPVIDLSMALHHGPAHPPLACCCAPRPSTARWHYVAPACTTHPFTPGAALFLLPISWLPSLTTPPALLLLLPMPAGTCSAADSGPRRLLAQPSTTTQAQGGSTTNTQMPSPTAALGPNMTGIVPPATLTKPSGVIAPGAGAATTNMSRLARNASFATVGKVIANLTKSNASRSASPAVITSGGKGMGSNYSTGGMGMSGSSMGMGGKGGSGVLPGSSTGANTTSETGMKTGTTTGSSAAGSNEPPRVHSMARRDYGFNAGQSADIVMGMSQNVAPMMFFGRG